MFIYLTALIIECEYLALNIVPKNSETNAGIIFLFGTELCRLILCIWIFFRGDRKNGTQVSVIFAGAMITCLVVISTLAVLSSFLSTADLIIETTMQTFLFALNMGILKLGLLQRKLNQRFIQTAINEE